MPTPQLPVPGDDTASAPVRGLCTLTIEDGSLLKDKRYSVVDTLGWWHMAGF